MTTPPNQADLETRIVNLGKRLHYHDPNAREQMRHRALQSLEDSRPEPRLRNSHEVMR